MPINMFLSKKGGSVKPDESYMGITEETEIPPQVDWEKELEEKKEPKHYILDAETGIFS